MTTYYMDSNAIVKRYVHETGTAWIQDICANPDNVIAMAHIGLVEIASGLASKYRQGLLEEVLYDRLLLDLRRDARDQYLLVDVEQSTVDQAINLT